MADANALIPYYETWLVRRLREKGTLYSIKKNKKSDHKAFFIGSGNRHKLTTNLLYINHISNIIQMTNLIIIIF